MPFLVVTATAGYIIDVVFDCAPDASLKFGHRTSAIEARLQTVLKGLNHLDVFLQNRLEELCIDLHVWHQVWIREILCGEEQISPRNAALNAERPRSGIGHVIEARKE